MGKHAQYAKRGSSAMMGFLPAPSSTDWSLGVPAVTSVPYNRLIPLPGGATDAGSFVQLAGGGAGVGTVGIAGGTPFNHTNLVTATNYQARMAWFVGARRVSDWSEIKLFTTA